MTPIGGSDNARHCTRLPSVAAPATQHRATGAALVASTHRLAVDELVEFDDNVLGEEVMAVLEGRIDVVAAGEHYVLSAGEAILVPPSEARRYRCLSPTGIVYRVTCSPGAPGEAESQS